MVSTGLSVITVESLALRRRRDAARNIHLIHLRRDGIRSHIHRDGDYRIARPGTERVSACAHITVRHACPSPSPGHRHQRQPRGQPLAHRYRSARWARARSVRYRHRIGRALLSLREISGVRTSGYSAPPDSMASASRSASWRR